MKLYKQRIANLKLVKATLRMKYNTERLIVNNDRKEKYIKKLTERLENTKEQNDDVQQDVKGKQRERTKNNNF